MATTVRKKLIEVALPLEFINPEATRQKKKAPKGYPTSIHKWWAQRPLATCRAVIFAQLVDDPSSWPDRFPTEEDQKRERERLHKIIQAIVPWEASTNEHLLNIARWEIARSVAWGLGEEPPSRSDPNAVLAYVQKKAPPIYDPFCGGGSIPLEAQRLGLRAYGSDLNPVAVLISKALVEIPPKFADRPPLNPGRDPHRTWGGAEGLANDLRYYAQWIRDEAEKRIGHHYPKAILPNGNEAVVTAWLWARTVASPDPMARGAYVPLISSFLLSSSGGKYSWIELVRDPQSSDGWYANVKTGSLAGEKLKEVKNGTRASQNSFSCVLTGAQVSYEYIDSEANAGRMKSRLIAIVADAAGRRVYLPPQSDHELAASAVEGNLLLDQKARGTFASNAQGRIYGFKSFGDYYLKRQLHSLGTISSLISEARTKATERAQSSGLPLGPGLAEGGDGAQAYGDAIATYLAFVVDRMALYGSTQSTWLHKDNAMRSAFNRQAIQMTWDFAEPNPFGKSSGDIATCANVIASCIEMVNTRAPGQIFTINAANGGNTIPRDCVVCTDPPYYHNVVYSDLSDYFYVWLRLGIKDVWPDLFRRVLTPKDEELVANPYRQGGQDAAEAYFLNGMRRALYNLATSSNPGFPVTIYYAFKQSEAAEEGLTSPGWATFLQAVFDAGFAVDGTWPVRSEGEVRMNSNSANALASSIVLVCRKRPHTAAVATRREFVARLKREMPEALEKIREAGVGPVDMAQSALGPGMGIFTSYAKVLEPDDSEMTVRTAIALINEVREEILGEEDAHYDPETRFCIDWFQAFGTSDGKSGDAIAMANAYNLGLADLEAAGVFHAKGGVARIVKRSDMPDDWHPSTDKRLTHWECAQHLIRVLDSEGGGGLAAAKLVAAMNPEDAEAARSLAYRLYDICEKKGWAQEAQAYNLLAEEFPHLEQAALDYEGERGPAQAAFDL